MLTAFTSTHSITPLERRELRKQGGVGLSGKEVAWTQTGSTNCKVMGTCCKNSSWKNALPQKHQQPRNKQNNLTLFPFTKLCKKSCFSFPAKGWGLGPAVGNEAVLPVLSMRWIVFLRMGWGFKRLLWVGAWFLYLPSHTQADAPHWQLCTDEWFWGTASFGVVLKLITVSSPLWARYLASIRWNKSWLFPPGCNPWCWLLQALYLLCQCILSTPSAKSSPDSCDSFWRDPDGWMWGWAKPQWV